MQLYTNIACKAHNSLGIQAIEKLYQRIVDF